MAINIFHARPKSENFYELCNLSRSSNGYERERAVKALAELGNADALPYLLERVNDWVPQVQIATVSAIHHLMVAANIGAFIHCLPHIVALPNYHRSNRPELFRECLDFIGHPEHLPSLLAGIASDNHPETARLCAMCIINQQLIPTDTMILEYFSTMHEQAKNEFAQALKKVDQTDRLHAVITVLLNERTVQLRRAGFQALLSSVQENDLDQVVPFLFDRHQALRRLAIGEVGQAFATDRYQQHIKKALLSGSTQHLVRALNELVKLKQASNVGFAEGLLVSPRFENQPQVRARALQVLVNAYASDLSTAMHYIGQYADDSHLEVQQMALSLGTQLGLYNSADNVLSILNEAVLQGRHTVSDKVFATYKYLNKWEQLIVLAEIAASKLFYELVTHVRWQGLFRLWNAQFNRTGRAPSTNQIRRLNIIAESIIDKISPAQYHEVRLALQTHDIKFELA